MYLNFFLRIILLLLCQSLLIWQLIKIYNHTFCIMYHYSIIPNKTVKAILTSLKSFTYYIYTRTYMSTNCKHKQSITLQTNTKYVVSTLHWFLSNGCSESKYYPYRAIQTSQEVVWLYLFIKSKEQIWVFFWVTFIVFNIVICSVNHFI